MDAQCRLQAACQVSTSAAWLCLLRGCLRKIVSFKWPPSRLPAFNFRWVRIVRSWRVTDGKSLSLGHEDSLMEKVRLQRIILGNTFEPGIYRFHHQSKKLRRPECPSSRYIVYEAAECVFRKLSKRRGHGAKAAWPSDMLWFRTAPSESFPSVGSFTTHECNSMNGRRWVQRHENYSRSFAWEKIWQSSDVCTYIYDCGLGHSKRRRVSQKGQKIRNPCVHPSQREIIK